MIGYIYIYHHHHHHILVIIPIGNNEHQRINDVSTD